MPEDDSNIEIERKPISIKFRTDSSTFEYDASGFSMDGEPLEWASYLPDSVVTHLRSTVGYEVLAEKSHYRAQLAQKRSRSPGGRVLYMLGGRIHESDTITTIEPVYRENIIEVEEGELEQLSDTPDAPINQVDLGSLVGELPTDNSDKQAAAGGDYSGWDFSGMSVEEIEAAKKSGKKPKKKRKKWLSG